MEWRQDDMILLTSSLSPLCTRYPSDNVQGNKGEGYPMRRHKCTLPRRHSHPCISLDQYPVDKCKPQRGKTKGIDREKGFDREEREWEKTLTCWH